MGKFMRPMRPASLRIDSDSEERYNIHNATFHRKNKTRWKNWSSGRVLQDLEFWLQGNSVVTNSSTAEVCVCKILPALVI